MARIGQIRVGRDCALAKIARMVKLPIGTVGIWWMSVYTMQFDNGVIAHMTKIWNSGVTMKELGWA